jgi:hypothetical protein
VNQLLYLDFLELPAVLNENLGLGGAAAAAHSLNRADHVHTLRHLTKDHVLAVEPDIYRTFVCRFACASTKKTKSENNNRETMKV